MEDPLTSQTPTTQGVARPENMSFPSDWFTSGWVRVLPRHQAFMLTAVMGTATAEGMRGCIDDVTRIIFGDDLPQAFRGIGENLDSPVRWLEEDELEDASEEEQQEIEEAAATRQAACEAMYRKAGIPVPSTIRDLAATMMALGIASQDEDGYWLMPDSLPLPEDVLDLPAEMAAQFQEFRRTQNLEPAERAIIHYLVKILDYPEEVFTSLDRLAEAAEMEAGEIRAGLDYLVEQGDARLYRGKPRTEVSARDLPAHARFYLVPDWEHFADHRIEIRRGRDADTD